jgi:hypothetical protein
MLPLFHLHLGMGMHPAIGRTDNSELQPAGLAACFPCRLAAARQPLQACHAGDSVEVSPVMGKGFPMAKLPVEQYSTVLMFATGSGIAPVKALIESSDLQVSVLGLKPTMHSSMPHFARLHHKLLSAAGHSNIVVLLEPCVCFTNSMPVLP